MLSEQVRLAGGGGVVVPTPQELLDIGLAHPPNFAPGAEYEYSNTNYVILGLIVEQLEEEAAGNGVRRAAVRHHWV